jgi:hypothetical protein
MSVSFTAIAGKISAVNSAVSQIFGGSGNVKLGSLTLSGIEVPETIRWGGRQSISSPELPGGIVNLFAMGICYPPLKWSGYFEGFNALSRSRVLYTMMNTAAIVRLSWNDRMYSVMVEEYTATDTQPNWIPYHVTVRVLRDETLFGYKPKSSLLAQVFGDITASLGITPSDLSDVSDAVGKAQVAAQAVGAVTAGSSASLALQSSLSGAQSAIGGATALANGNIAGLAVAAAGAGSVFPGGSAATGAANVQSAVLASSHLAALSAMKGQVGRAQANVKNAST